MVAGTLQVPKPGDVLLGKFRVERVLGRGGMGVVVAATHLQLGQAVALKFLLPHALVRPEARARFEREARAVAMLKSEHVAHILDVGKLENGAPYMVLEYLEGETLAKRLHDGGPRERLGADLDSPVWTRQAVLMLGVVANGAGAMSASFDDVVVDFLR